MITAFGKLLQSRKFLLLCLDTVISLTMFFVSKYALPGVAEDIGFIIGVLQIPFAAIIIAISVEDGAAIRAGTHPTCCKPSC